MKSALECILFSVSEDDATVPASQRCPKCGTEYNRGERFCSRDGSILVYSSPHPVQDESKTSDQVASIVGDGYTIISELGAGGMGAVFLARHRVLDRLVAIKILHEDTCDDQEAIGRFLREARVSSKLDHENIVSVFDFGRDGEGNYFLVMEYVEGPSLRRILATEAPLDQLRVASILHQILTATTQAHKKDIIHRDLKPENIICTRRRGEKDFIKILDFGLAKILGEDEHGSGRLTQVGYVMGTPDYMAPEQAAGLAVDHRCDLYSIGMIAYEMLSGGCPFTGKPAEILRAQVSDEPRELAKASGSNAVHPDFSLFVHRLIAKDPAERFDSAEGAGRALEKIVRKLSIAPESEGEGVLAKTRAAILPRSAKAAAVVGGTRYSVLPNDSRPVDGAVTEYQGENADTLTDAPIVLDEVHRLSALWNRRVVEVADLLWGHGKLPPYVRSALSESRELESSVTDLETDIALLENQLEESEQRARRAEGELRLQRIDLVAQLGAIQEAVSIEYLAMDNNAFADEAPSTPSPSVGAAPKRPSDLRLLRTASETLEKEILKLDRSMKHLAKEQVVTAGALGISIQKKIRRVHRLQSRLVPLYAGIAARVNEQSADRPDLADHVSALTEIAGAIQVYQAILTGMGMESRI